MHDDSSLSTHHSSLVLRPGQDRVAAYEGGRLAVPAVPGAGKTTCLAYLAAKLLAGEPVTKILILTVMNSAVSNFKRKISGFLAERGLPPRGYQVKTLHSLAAMILKERPEYLMINEAFEILDEQQRSDMLRGIVERWLGNNRHRWKIFLDSGHLNEYYETKWRERLTGTIPEIIKLIKLRGFTPGEQDEIRARLQEVPDGFLHWAFEVMDSYERRKRREAAVDFDDLILYAYRLLRDDEGVRQRLQERWTHIFEDEAQDSNPLQEKILDLLCAGHGNLIRVGDTNQGIMRFSGTDPELFRRFCLQHPRQPIEVASRSTGEIMGLANHLVDWVRSSYVYSPCRNALEDHKIRGVDPGDPHPNPVVDGPSIHTFLCDGNDRKEEMAAAQLAIDLARSDGEATIAILARQNASLGRIADRLKQERDIEFDFVGGRPDDLEDFHRVAAIWTVLRFLAEPFDGDRLQAVLGALIPGIGDDADGQVRQFAAAHQSGGPALPRRWRAGLAGLGRGGAGQPAAPPAEGAAADQGLAGDVPPPARRTRPVPGLGTRVGGERARPGQQSLRPGQHAAQAAPGIRPLRGGRGAGAHRQGEPALHGRRPPGLQGVRTPPGGDLPGHPAQGQGPGVG